jgi:hypothetical protein
MDGLDALFYCLILVFLGTIAYMQLQTLSSKETEGFATASSPAAAAAAAKSSVVEKKIRKALDPYLNSDLCEVYTELRKVLAQGIQGNELTPTADTLQKVNAYLTKELTTAPLPCPSFTYPTGKAELEWVNFLNEVPTDIGAKFVLMSLFAQRELAFRAKNVKLALNRSLPIPDSEKDADEKVRISKKVLLSAFPTEGFDSIIGICPVSVQDTRRMEAKYAGCKMPDDMTHEEIVQSVDNILQKMSADTKTILGQKFISPDIDVKPFIADAKKSSDYLKTMKAKSLDGSLVYEMGPAP